MNKIQTLKASEMAIVERTAGLSIATLESPDYPKVGILGAIGWVLKREEPTLTYDAYMEANTLEDVTDFIGLSDED